MTFWYGSGSAFLLFEDTFTPYFKNKKSKRSNKTVGNKVFLTTVFLLDDRRVRIRTSDKRIRIQEAQKKYGSDGSGSATLVKSKSLHFCKFLQTKILHRKFTFALFFAALTTEAFLLLLSR
jgi:hypothetical protein